MYGCGVLLLKRCGGGGMKKIHDTSIGVEARREHANPPKSLYIPQKRTPGQVHDVGDGVVEGDLVLVLVRVQGHGRHQGVAHVLGHVLVCGVCRCVCVGACRVCVNTSQPRQAARQQATTTDPG